MNVNSNRRKPTQQLLIQLHLRAAEHLLETYKFVNAYIYETALHTCLLTGLHILFSLVLLLYRCINFFNQRFYLFLCHRHILHALECV